MWCMEMGVVSVLHIEERKFLEKEVCSLGKSALAEKIWSQF